MDIRSFFKKPGGGAGATEKKKKRGKEEKAAAAADSSVASPGEGGKAGRKQPEAEAEPMEVEGDDESEEVVVSPAVPGKRRAMEGPAGGNGSGGKGAKKAKAQAAAPSQSKSKSKKAKQAESDESDEFEVMPVDLASSDDDEGTPSGGRRRATPSRKPKTAAASSSSTPSPAASASGKGKRKQIVEEEEEEDEAEESEAAWDASSSEEEEESSDEDFGAAKKKGKGKGKKKKEGGKSKKAKREEAEEPPAAATAAAARTTRASAPTKGSPSPASKARLLKETTAADYFSSATRSQFFDHKPSPGPAGKPKPSPSAAAAKSVKQEVVAVDDDDEEEEEEDKPSAAAAIQTAAAAAPSPAKPAKAPPAVKKEEVVEVMESDEVEAPAAAAKAQQPKPQPGSGSGSGAASVSSTSTSTPGGGGFKSSGGGGGFRSWNAPRSGALNPGCRPIPEGRPDCLEGKTFVLTGVYEAVDREGMEDLIKQHGGRITGSVSKKTSFLVTGMQLEDGRAVEEGKKYKTAKEAKTRVVTEVQLFDMIAKTQPVKQEEVEESKPPQKKPPTPARAPTSPRPASASAAFAAAAPAAAAAAAAPVIPAYKPGAPPPRKPPSPARPLTAPARIGGAGAGGKVETELWTDKYAPKAMTELIGGGALAQKLAKWLQDWDALHRYKTKPVPKPTGGYGGGPGGGGGKSENPGAKAALLSGPPGIGKSTTAALVARLQGFTVFELNASDTRNKKTLQEELASVIDNTSLPLASSASAAAASPFGSGKKGKAPAGPAPAPNSRGRVIIMDEVDGMSGSDRGGVQELILMIKRSKVPIICICNDRGSTKVRSLANHCYDLRFQRPNKSTVAQRMVDIAHREGLNADRNAIEHLVESVGNDVRQVLNTLQMWAKSSDRMTYMDVKGRMGGIDKDKTLRMSAFDACRQIIAEPRSTSFLDRLNSFFVDYSLMPLLVQQNYLDAVKNRKESLVERLKATQLAAEAVSDQDLAGSMIMGGDQHWELLPLQAALNVKVGYHANCSFAYPQFPQWLGKNSTTNKRRRLLHELAIHLAGRISGSTQAIRLEYLPALRTRLLSLLRVGGDVQAAIQLLDDYGLSREDLMETMAEMTLAEGKPDPLAGIDSKTKAALTREYNKGTHKAQGLAWHTQQGGKATKKKGGGGGGLGGMGGAVDEDGTPLETEAAAADDEASANGGNGEEDEESLPDLSAFVAKKGKGKGKAAAASSAAASSAGGGGGKGRGKGKAKK